MNGNSDKTHRRPENRVSEIFDALSSGTRRHTLDYLRDWEQSIHRADIARQIEDRLKEDVEEINVRLGHVHLPMLDDIGAVDYDRDMEDARYQGDDLIEEALDIALQLEEQVGDRTDYL